MPASALAQQAELLDHHYVGLSDIQRAAGIASHFDTLLVFESYPIDREAIAAASSIDGMSVTDVGVDSATHYPLTLQVTAESTLEFTLEYLISRFTADEVETLSTRLIRVLDALVGDAAGLVGDIDILDADERARLLVESGIATTAPAPEPVGRVGARTVSRVLAEVVEADPEAPALLVEGDEIAYHELDRRSSQLARVLIAHGAGPGDVVALALPRSVDAVVAVWAIQKAGAACLFAGDLSAAEMATAGAIFGITLEPVDGPINWLVPSDPAVQAELATAPSHPVSYADRVRPLAEEHPAFVVLAADGTVRAFSQTEALEQAEQVRSEYDIDYESTTLTTAVSGRVAFLESLSAATAGALSVLPSTDDIADDLADGEVTHWFVTVNEPTDAADEDIRIVVLGSGGSGQGHCPTLYATDQDSYLVQGWQTDHSGTIEIPHLLLGFADPDTFVGATMTDTGRGTFTISGRPITDAETLDQLDLAEDETAIEVPRRERKFYGATCARRGVLGSISAS
ncbi:AMP-binding protein [Nocardia sp. NPDC052112]|uniref:AMP-binding protein n=1 Tax=Nocardia sp. NPDC052112 TaxID=3155646 RepID=UPI003432F14E